MKRLFAAILFVAVFVLSCGQASQNTDLRLMLSDIPSELASNNVLWFHNMERIKELAGVSPDTGLNEYINKTTEREVLQLRMDLLSGYTVSDFSGGRFLASWSDAFGFDAFDSNQEIWISQVELKGTRPLFSVMKGEFDKENIIEKLDTIGYELKKHASSDYFSINEDYSIGDQDASEPLRMSHGFLNRIMVNNREIIAAPADDIFFAVLDVRSDEQNSLKDTTPYTRVAQALGDVLGAALIPQSILNSEKTGADWGILHSYDLVGIGYCFERQARKIVIVLHYTDQSASDDVDELSHRMAEYKVTTGNLETPLLSDLFIINDPKVTNYETDSILKIELLYKPDTPSALWSDLVVFQDLGFLVSNLSE